MKIAIIGAGNVGGTLGKKWAQAGHEIRFGVRNPEAAKYHDLRSAAEVQSIEEALGDAEVILLALPGEAVAEFSKEHAKQLDGKIIIDATNIPSPMEMSSYAVLKENAPGMRYLRAFCTLGWENFADPQLGSLTIDLFYCGHSRSRPVIERLIEDIGLRPVYVGEEDAVAMIDGLTRLWFSLAFGQGLGRRIAFKLLEDPEIR